VSWRLTHSRGFMCDCSHCILGMLRQGSRGRRGERGCSNGCGHFGKCDGRDRSITIARRRCRSVFCGDRGVALVGGYFTGGTCVWAKVSLTRLARRRRRGAAPAPLKLRVGRRFRTLLSHHLLPLALASCSPRSFASAVPPLLALPTRPRLRHRDVERDALQRVLRATPPSH
jgi:hypothetical protein